MDFVEPMIKVLLYYIFTNVPQPLEAVKEHTYICSELGLRGRILINKIGMNGTVAGEEGAILEYRRHMDAHPLWQGIDFKESVATFMPFPKMKIKYRKEIIATGMPDSCDLNNCANHVDRDTFHQWLTEGRDIVLFDLRNDYEYAVGRFKNAIRPPMKYFRDTVDCIEYYTQWKNKTVVMYCTGGIRCEPGSSLFRAAGFEQKNTYQPLGGIVKYAEKYGNEGFFEGACYVFDDRLVVPVNTSNTRVIVGRCSHCNEPTEQFQNCANKYCNLHFLGCDDCVKEYKNTCSLPCQKIIQDNQKSIRPHLRCALYNK